MDLADDVKGNKVLDTDGKEILYPRVGMDNESEVDLPVQLDEDGSRCTMKASDEARWMKQAQKEAYSVLLPHCGK